MQTFYANLKETPEEFNKAWSDFMAPMGVHVKQACMQKLVEIFPRELVPVVESAFKAKSVPEWEDVFNVSAAKVVASSSLHAGAVADQRHLADSILSLWRMLPASGEWQIELQKNGGTETSAEPVVVKVGADAALVAIYIVAAYWDMGPVNANIVVAAEWQSKLGAEARPNLVKAITSSVDGIKCLETTFVQLADGCSRLVGLSMAATAAVAHSMVLDAAKSIERKMFAKLIASINDIMNKVQESFTENMSNFVDESGTNMWVELDKLSAEGGQLTDEAVQTYVKICGMKTSKDFYIDFRFWNENIVTFHSHAKALCVAGGGADVNGWDDSHTIVSAGRLCGSMTLLQGLTQKPEKQADVLAKTVKGLALLGRGLMDGHVAVQGKVNQVLAAAADSGNNGKPATKKARKT